MISAGDPPRKREEGVASTNLSGLIICTLGRGVANMTRALRHYDVVPYLDSTFLQMFLWECFEALTPAPVEYSATVSNRIGVASPTGAKNI